MPQRGDKKQTTPVFLLERNALSTSFQTHRYFILTEYVAIDPKVCVWICVCLSLYMYVCMSVCVCVCVCLLKRCNPNKAVDIDETPHKWSERYLRVLFFRFWKFKIHDVMAAIFSSLHTHGRNFALIFFTIADKVETCLLLFAIENQLNRLVTSANMVNLVS